ncbi:MAG TPA: S24 family peptidase, partial [Segetibacter sp.]
GDAMTGAGIFSGDVLIVDRSIAKVNGKVIVAVLDGEMIVRRYENSFNKTRLIPQTDKLAAIEIDPFADFSIWGVVTYVIHTP